VGGDRVPGPFDDDVDEETRIRREIIKRTFGVEEEGLSPGELLEGAQASWTAEFGRLDEVAHDTLARGVGGFLTKYAQAWLYADAWNKRLMRPVWEAFIRKYNLEEDPRLREPVEPREDP